MSYIYLQEQGGESLVESFVDIPLYVLLRLNISAERSCFKDNEMESCQSSQFGMMFAHLTEYRGEGKLTLSVEDSHAKTSALLENELELRESEALLDELFAHATGPEHTWTQKWKVGDLIIWDNRCTLHARSDFDASERRKLRRITVLGLSLIHI